MGQNKDYNRDLLLKNNLDNLEHKALWILTQIAES